MKPEVQKQLLQNYWGLQMNNMTEELEIINSLENTSDDAFDKIINTALSKIQKFSDLS